MGRTVTCYRSAPVAVAGPESTYSRIMLALPNCISKWNFTPIALDHCSRCPSRGPHPARKQHPNLLCHNSHPFTWALKSVRERGTLHMPRRNARNGQEQLANQFYRSNALFSTGTLKVTFKFGPARRAGSQGVGQAAPTLRCLRNRSQPACHRDQNRPIRSGLGMTVRT